jgi:hypothetical protein
VPAKTNLKRLKRSPQYKTAARPIVPIEDDGRHAVDVDDFIARNHDALNESIRQSRKQVSKGKVTRKTIDELIAEGRARNDRKT